MNRLLVTLASVALFCLGVLSLKSVITRTSAQTATSEDIVLPLPISNNNLGVRLRSVSNDGTRMVFESTSNVFGGNGENNIELYTYDTTTLTVVQLTNTANFTDATNSTVIVNNRMGTVSGDGSRIVFLSNAQALDPANPNNDGNYEIYMTDWPTGGVLRPITRITDTGNELPDDNERNNISNDAVTISDDGSLIAFVSGRQRFNPINGFPAFTADNPDHNDEVIVCRINDRQYLQVTHSDPVADRQNPFLPGGFNLKPKVSGDGTVVAWLSDFNYANANLDQNGEIFITQIGSGNIRQITNTAFSNGYGAVVPVFDTNLGAWRLDPTAPVNDWELDTKPFNYDGTKLVLESAGNLNGNNPNKARQLWLYNVPDNTFTMIINQAVSATPTQGELAVLDYTFSPSINSTGTFVTFNSSRNIVPASTSDVNTDNADGSKEIFRYDVNVGSIRQLTFTPTSANFTDQRTNQVVSYINDSGDTASFYYTTLALLPNGLNVDDLYQVVTRPIASPNNGGTAVGNAASFNTDQVARGSLAVALTTPVADAPPAPQSPFILNGVSVTMGRIAARISSISGQRIVFQIPNGIPAAITPYSINDNGRQYTGNSVVTDSAPGLFSVDGTGSGPGSIRCLSKFQDGTDVYSDPPCPASNDTMTSIIFGFGTGWRNAGGIQVKINDRTLDVIYSGAEGGNNGVRDQFNVMVPSDLGGVTNADISVVVTSTSVESNRTKISFQGGPTALTVNDDGTGLSCLIKSAGLADVYAPPPCPVSSASTTSILVIYGFGWRSAASTQVRIDNDLFTPIYSGVRGGGVDGDQINLLVPPAMVGRTGLLSVLVPGTSLESNRVNVSFMADPMTMTLNAAADCLVKTPGQPDVYMPPPCPVSNGDTVSILVLYGTGWRYATGTQVKIDNDLYTPIWSGPRYTTPVDQVNLLLPPSLAGRTGQVSVVIPGTNVATNAVSIPFLAGP